MPARRQLSRLGGRLSAPQIWAHRGAPLGWGELPPENSLAAFRRALESGCDALEFDLHLTRDGKFVIFHDLYMVHPKRGRVALADLEVSEIREVPLPDGSDIPLLEDLVTLVDKSEVPLIPELKKPGFSKSRGLEPVPALCREIDRLQLGKRVVVQCFNRQALDELHALQPDLPLLALYRHDQKVHLDDIPGQAEYLGVPMLSVFFYGRRLAQKVRERGRKLVPWREMGLSENAEVFQRLAEFKVFAVMVDDAQRAMVHYGRLARPPEFDDYEWHLMCEEQSTQCRRSRKPETA